MRDVLVARIAPGFAFASSAANSARLASRFSKIASMMTSARAMPSPATSGISRSVASRTRRGSLQPAREQLRRAGHRRREPLGVLVLQRDGQAAQRAPRRDVAAHRAGADHVHVRRLEVAFLAQRLQPLLQPEDADQVGGRRRLEQRRDRRRIGRRHGERVAVVLRPRGRGSRTAPDSARAARAWRPACAPARRSTGAPAD